MTKKQIIRNVKNLEKQANKLSAFAAELDADAAVFEKMRLTLRHATSDFRALSAAMHDAAITMLTRFENEFEVED